MVRLHRLASWLLLLGLFLALGGHDMLLALEDHDHHHGDATTSIAQASPASRTQLQPSQPPGPAALTLLPEPLLPSPLLVHVERQERGLPPPWRPLGPPTGLRAPPSFS